MCATSTVCVAICARFVGVVMKRGRTNREYSRAYKASASCTHLHTLAQ